MLKYGLGKIWIYTKSSSLICLFLRTR